MLFILLAKSLIIGSAGKIGGDSDDLLRLIQVRNFLNGQSWFDVTQYDLGTAGGTLMHWSRIPDIPLIVFASFFGLFVSPPTAEMLSYSLAPPLSAALVFAGLFAGARHIGPKYHHAFAIILGMMYILLHHRFMPGAIDHHNIQLGLLIIASGFLIDPEFKKSSFAIAGAASALSVAVGPEVYVLIAVLCASCALLFLFAGSVAHNGIRAFGLSFALTSLLAFIATTAPENYLRVYCDSFSMITVLSSTIGGFGLAIATLPLFQRSFPTRLIVLSGIGGICLLALFVNAPQCLSNPLNALPADVRNIWLSNINEARTLWTMSEHNLLTIAAIIGPTAFAFYLCLNELKNRRYIFANSLFMGLLLVSILFAFYQVRFFIFGQLFALIPIACWAAQVYEKSQSRESFKLLPAALAVALGLQNFWAVPSIIYDTAVKKAEASTSKTTCTNAQAVSMIKDLPAGLIIASSDYAPAIIGETDHRSLNGNYHRNVDGLLNSIHTLLGTPPEAEKIIRKHSVNYILLCPPSGFDRHMINNATDESLIRHLQAGNVPGFLNLVKEDNETKFRLYKVL